MEVLTMIKEAIIKIVNKGDLTYDEAHQVMMEIMKGETTPTQNAAFLAALSTKSTKAETIDEISGCAEAMRSLATPVPHPGMEVLEIVGTGGDGAHSFNISTTSAMVLAAGGVKVAKHGNRAASSLCGTADCLEALGINIQQDPQLALKMLEETNFCFLFAQKYHAAMKYVGPIRKELGFRTVFNILGPLTNPAKPEMFLLGVYDGYLVEPLAKVLASLGVKRGLVAYGQENSTKSRRTARRRSANSATVITGHRSSNRKTSASRRGRKKTSSAGRRKSMPRLPAMFCPEKSRGRNAMPSS